MWNKILLYCIATVCMERYVCEYPNTIDIFVQAYKKCVWWYIFQWMWWEESRPITIVVLNNPLVWFSYILTILWYFILYFFFVHCQLDSSFLKMQNYTLSTFMFCSLIAMNLMMMAKSQKGILLRYYFCMLVCQRWNESKWCDVWKRHSVMRTQW